MIRRSPARAAGLRPFPARALRVASRLGRAGFSMLAEIGQLRREPCTAVLARSARLSAAFAELCDIHDLEIEVSGAIPEGPAIIAANHLSYLDPVIVSSVAPVVPISKAEVSDWPVIGTGARELGVLFVDRDDPLQRAAILRRAWRALRAGAIVLNFPEGTTTDGSVVLPFRRGAFGLATLAEVPVVPLYVSYECASLTWTDDAPFIPHYIKTAAREATRCSLRFGEPMSPFRHTSARAFAARARRAVIDLASEGASHATDSVRVHQPRTDAVFSAASG